MFPDEYHSTIKKLIQVVEKVEGKMILGYFTFHMGRIVHIIDRRYMLFLLVRYGGYIESWCLLLGYEDCFFEIYL